MGDSKKKKVFLGKESLVFYECTNLIQPTGFRAQNARELLSLIRKVEPGVIYHHTHQFYLKAAVDIPEYSNDFAVWASDALEERALAEKLACLDMFTFSNIEEIRKALIAILKSYLSENLTPRPARTGDAFFFNDTITLILPVGLLAKSIPDFIKVLHQVGTSSIYFHFFEAKMRMGRLTDDFSAWLETSMGDTELAARIRRLDPYHYSLEGLRQEMLFIVQHYAGMKV